MPAARTDCRTRRSVAEHGSRGRRTQAERSAATRGRLLEAAAECLTELGYAGTTTTVVATRAGVSRGAQLHHYRTRSELVAAAVEHVFTRLTDDYRRGFSALAGASEEERVEAAVDLLWSMYTTPLHQAVLELYVAARTDAELRERLSTVAGVHSDNVIRLAGEYFPRAAASSRFQDDLQWIMATMLGMALGGVVQGHASASTDLLLSLRRLAREAVEAASG